MNISYGGLKNELREKGWPVKKIARELGVTYPCIRNRFKWAEYDYKPKVGRPSDKTSNLDRF